MDVSALPARAAELAGPAAGYSVRHWVGAAPDDLVGGIAALDSRFLDEAPLGQLGLEALNVDASWVRELERSKRVRGRHAYHTVALHDATGEVAAWCVVDTYGAHSHGDQAITLMLPEHRGHRLGLLTKLVNLRQVLAAEPQLVALDTWNAEVNTHMIAINEALGFRVVDAWDAWQLEL